MDAADHPGSAARHPQVPGSARIPPGISTNLLAERLARLVEEGLAIRTLYSDKPPRAEYHLTEQGEQLASVVDALFEWGVQWRGWGEAPELRTLREMMIRELGLQPGDVRSV